MARWITIAVLVAFAIAMVPVARRKREKFDAHSDAMKAWATSHGCSFALEDDSQYAGHTFYPFGQADRQHAYRVITGTYAERTIAVYDFVFTAKGGTSAASDVYFAMIVMQLPADVPTVHVTKRDNVRRHDRGDAIPTGDEAFDDIYATFASNQDYAKAAISATVRGGLPAHELSGRHITGGRLYLWRTRRKHDLAVLEDRLRFAATVVAELPPPS